MTPLRRIRYDLARGTPGPQPGDVLEAHGRNGPTGTRYAVVSSRPVQHREVVPWQSWALACLRVDGDADPDARAWPIRWYARGEGPADTLWGFVTSGLVNTTA